MDRKTKILYRVYLAAGLFCLLVLLASSYPNIAGLKLRPDARLYGELYDMCKIDRFRIHRTTDGMPPDPKPHEHAIGEARVMFIGDSFMEKDFGWDIGTMFEKKTGTPVSAKAFRGGTADTPMDVLDKLGYTTGGGIRYLVLVYVERVLILTPSIGGGDKAWSGPGATGGGGSYETIEFLKQASVKLESLKRSMIKPMPLEYIVTENPAGHKLLSFRNTLRFDVFGDMSWKIPVYSIDPPMLHYYLEVASNRAPKDRRFVMNIADYVKVISDELDHKYGIKLIFMPVPNKYTLYGYEYDRYNYNTSGGKYDQFMRRLYDKLDRRGVTYINLLDDFKANRELVFDPSHEHWNFRGKDIAVSKLVEEYRRLEAGATSSQAPSAP